MVKPFRLSTRSPAPGMHPSDSSYIQQIALALQTISHQLADQNKIEEIKKVSFKEGDCLVLTYSGCVGEVEIKNLRELWEIFTKKIGFEIPIMIFEDGMTIEVLSKE